MPPKTATIYRAIFLSDPHDIVSVPDTGDRCLTAQSLWDNRLMFVRLRTIDKKSVILRVSGFHTHRGGFDDAVFVPGWVFEKLNLEEDGTQILIEWIGHEIAGMITNDDSHSDGGNDTIIDEPPVLSACTRLKLKASTNQFHETVCEPREWLENALKSISVINENVTLTLTGPDAQTYEFTVVEMEPRHRYHATHVIETEVELEFEQPEDYVPRPIVPIREAAIVSTGGDVSAAAPTTFVGRGYTLSDTAASIGVMKTPTATQTIEERRRLADLRARAALARLAPPIIGQSKGADGSKEDVGSKSDSGGGSEAKIIPPVIKRRPIKK